MQTNVQQTSLWAYHNEVQPTLGDRQKVVYEALGTRENFTNNEMAHWLSWPINTITPRMKELRVMGLVRQAGIRECKITGRNVMCWEIGKII